MTLQLAEPSVGDVAMITSVSAERRQVHVRGVVQGVGFRPFVYALATRLGLGGWVGNDGAGVFIEVEGNPGDLALFERELVSDPPPLARIDQMATTLLPTLGERTFKIVNSLTGASERTLVSPDLSICGDCLRELFDPADRRYHYPFINCTHCGPRYTIIEGTPYDRPRTTMSDFPLCPECSREYLDPRNRRFHAQPNACPRCGPHLEFRWAGEHVPAHLAHLVNAGMPVSQREQALSLAQRVLASGGIVAVKGIGGYHLACDATNDTAVEMLRQRKSRAEKPLAVMVRDLDTLHSIAFVDDAEKTLLTSRERPIVLLRKRSDSPLSAHVAPDNPSIGVMLPYSALHYLLFEPSGDALWALPDGSPPTGEPAAPRILVMTSGNYASEPIVADDGEALERLSSMADGFLLHNRAIHAACDDSVLRVVDGVPLPIRRSRGYVPLPIQLPVHVRPLLAVGGELKNAFCIANDEHAFLSRHIGDMQNVETLGTFTRAVNHMQSLFRIAPETVACDMHPGYLSTQWTEAHAGARRLIQVQHHHAHIASVMAEHGLDGSAPVIGFVFDGTGYGTDGAIWGGEVLIADYRGFRRAAHLRYFPLPGGDSAVRHPCRTALAALWAAGIEWDETLASVAACSEVERGVLRRQFETGFATVPTSSMGRLFDAVASLIGVRQNVSYEAQAAIELESLIDEADMGDNTDPYRFSLPCKFGKSINAAPLLERIVEDVRGGVAPGVIADRFHNAVADLILDVSLWLRATEGLNDVALSGGVFQNAALLRRSVKRLRAAKFNVLTHRQTPPNDGGLALGQAMIAHAVLMNEGN